MLYFTKDARFTKDDCYCVALCTDDKEEQERHLQGLLSNIGGGIPPLYHNNNII